MYYVTIHVLQIFGTFDKILIKKVVKIYTFIIKLYF
jgi:hypothetical protein